MKGFVILIYVVMDLNIIGITSNKLIKQLHALASSAIDDCSCNPCKNGGSCQAGVNTYTCHCLPAYSGPQCGIGKLTMEFRGYGTNSIYYLACG